MDASAVDGTFSVNGEDQETGDEKIDGHTRSLGSENKFQKAIAAWKGTRPHSQLSRCYKLADLGLKALI